MDKIKFADNLIKLKETDSTNLEAFRIARKCAVVCEYQTQGRGRLGRSFIANRGESLLLSVLETDVLKPELTAWTGVVICKILRSHKINASIKWPNDIIVNGKKICGILCEMKNDAVVIGIGINLYQTNFDDLNDIAISAKMCGVNIDKDILIKEILDGLDQMLLDYPNQKKSYIKFFKENCNTLNREIAFLSNDEEIHAFAKDIDDDFRLILELSDGSTIVKDSGEITLSLK